MRRRSQRSWICGKGFAMLIKRHHLLGTAALLAWALICVQSQGQNGQMPGTIKVPTDQPPLPPKKHKPPKKPKPPFSTYLPDKASWQPRFEIRVAPLGFAP